MKLHVAWLGLVLGVSSACTPDFEPVTWQALDVDLINDTLDNPTAPLNAQTLGELDSLSGDEVRFTQGLLAVIRALLGVAENADADAPTVETDVDLEGTQVYLKAACPGPIGDELDREFRYGSLTLFSPTLSNQAIEEWSARGNLLGVFEDCVVDDVVITGEVRAFRDNVRNSLTIVPEVQVEGPSETLMVRLPASEELGMRIRLLFRTSEDQTLILERDGSIETTEYTVRGVDRELLCDTANDPPCPPL